MSLYRLESYLLKYDLTHLHKCGRHSTSATRTVQVDCTICHTFPVLTNNAPAELHHKQHFCLGVIADTAGITTSYTCAPTQQDFRILSCFVFLFLTFQNDTILHQKHQMAISPNRKCSVLVIIDYNKHICICTCACEVETIKSINSGVIIEKKPV